MQFSITPSRHYIIVREPAQSNQQELVLAILAGYRICEGGCWGDVTILLTRRRSPDGKSSIDAFIRVDGRRVHCAEPRYCLNEPRGDLERFKEMNEGASFQLNGRRWRKCNIGGLAVRFSKKEFSGSISHGPIAPPMAEMIIEQEKFPAFHELFRRGQPDNPLKKYKSSAIKFTIQYGRLNRPRHRAFVMAGYSNGETTFVLYRVRNGGEGLAKLIPPDHVTIDDDDDMARLPEFEWGRLMAMPASQTFRMAGGPWKRLSAQEAGALVSGKVFKVLIRQDTGEGHDSRNSFEM